MRVAILGAAALLLAAGCGGEDDRGPGFGSGLSTPTSASLSGTDSGGSGTDGATEPAGLTDGVSTGADATSLGTGTDAASDSADPTVPNPDGQPNGSECSDPAQCMSGNCYEIPLPVDGLPPGICSVCDADADCVDASLGSACTVDAVTLGAKCSHGEAGSFCETQEACALGLFCTSLIDGADGLLPHSCSECAGDGDCDGGLRCVPVLDVAAYSGQKHCAAPGSVASGGLCPLPAGDAMCATGKCALLDLGGLLEVGVCGVCKVDADCPMGQTCAPPKFQDGFIGSACA